MADNDARTEKPTNSGGGSGWDGAQPRLVVLDGEHPNVEYPINEGVNWARKSDEKAVDIDLGDQESPDEILVSREHARILFENNQLFIVGPSSRHGTSVNGNMINHGTRHPLALNAIIQICTVRLQVRV